MALGRSLRTSLPAWAAFLVWQSVPAPFASPSTAPATLGPPQASTVASLADLGGVPILDRAIRRLTSVQWLALELRQSRTQGKDAWTAEGTLQRGPNGCARLDLTLRNGTASAAQHCVVSDGVALAQAFGLVGRQPRLTGVSLPVDAPARELELQKVGCGGPEALLRQLRETYGGWQVTLAASETGPVLVLTGALSGEPGQRPGEQAVRVRLDASTLWPTRVEWAHAPGPGLDRPTFVIEMSRPRLNQALSPAECAKVFTYRPE